ncbi:MAG TPA: L,D-transpeptidase family protein [Edaphobacter sp.]|nr:L,D-transpeptidase family protein [Edaphobacter sp.]
MLVLLVMCCAVIVVSGRTSFAKTGDVAAGSTQMIVVTTPDWNSLQGRLQRYERAKVGEAWQPVDGAISIVTGKHGMAWGLGAVALDGVQAVSDPMKREGDGRSPAGVFGLGTAFGFATEPLAGMTLPYLSLTASTECVDDVDSASYNRIVDRSKVTVDWKSSEHMRDVGEAYRWGIVVNHNGIANPVSGPQPLRGDGSCIFLHIWKDAAHGTAGCMAMAPANIEALLRWVDPTRKPALVELPVDVYARVMKQWGLPEAVGLPER